MFACPPGEGGILHQPEPLGKAAGRLLRLDFQEAAELGDSPRGGPGGIHVQQVLHLPHLLRPLHARLHPLQHHPLLPAIAAQHSLQGGAGQDRDRRSALLADMTGILWLDRKP